MPLPRPCPAAGRVRSSTVGVATNGATPPAGRPHWRCTRALNGVCASLGAVPPAARDGVVAQPRRPHRGHCAGGAPRGVAVHGVPHGTARSHPVGRTLAHHRVRGKIRGVACQCVCLSCCSTGTPCCNTGSPCCNTGTPCCNGAGAVRVWFQGDRRRLLQRAEICGECPIHRYGYQRGTRSTLLGGGQCRRIDTIVVMPWAIAALEHNSCGADYGIADGVARPRLGTWHSIVAGQRSTTVPHGRRCLRASG